MKVSAFSLLELSIVLVIIGLLAGGITVGADMVRAAELRSLITQKDQFTTAITLFKDKYMAIPGDMKNATAFWGVAHATPATCEMTVGTGTQTCNGDGNGIILYGQEGFRFWQHLANAGLIEGSFTGVTGPSNPLWHSIVGVNVPSSKMSSVGWSALSINYGNHSTLPRLDPNFTGAWQYTINQWHVGKEYSSLWTYGSFLTPEELWGIDTKMDDGKPGTGSVIAGGYNTCTDAADAQQAGGSTANYLLSSKAIGCSIIFMPSATGL